MILVHRSFVSDKVLGAYRNYKEAENAAREFIKQQGRYPPPCFKHFQDAHGRMCLDYGNNDYFYYIDEN